MSSLNKASQEYLKNAVMTASPEQLQLMLLDGAIRFATQGLEALQARDREATLLALDRAQRITLELGLGLNRDANPELVDQMRSLYSFCYRRLIAANMEQSTAAVHDALRVFRHQRETWALLDERIRTTTAPARGIAAGRPPGGPSALAAAKIEAPSPVADDTRFVAEG